MEIPSRQEMFNRAYLGLKSQGFQRAHSLADGCLYLMDDGKRCAWGWVDPEGTVNQWGQPMVGSVTTLASRGCGIAAGLGLDDMEFAMDLQEAHDRTDLWPADGRMAGALAKFAAKYGLTIPTSEG